MARLLFVALLVISSTEQFQARLKRHHPYAKKSQLLINRGDYDILGNARFHDRQDYIRTRQPGVPDDAKFDDTTHPNASGFIIPRENPTHPNASGFIIPRENPTHSNASGFIIPRENPTHHNASGFIVPRQNPTHPNATGFIIPRPNPTQPNATGFIIPRPNPTQPNATGFIIPRPNPTQPNTSGLIMPRDTSRDSRHLTLDLPALPVDLEASPVDLEASPVDLEASPVDLEASRKVKREEQIHIEKILGKYRLQQDERAVSCGPHVLQPGSKVAFTTRRFPRPYPAGYKCFWSFEVAGSPSDGKLELECPTFLLPSCWRGSWRWRRRCRSNYLALSHASSKTYKKYLGRKGPQGITLEGGVLKLFLNTLRGFRARGFSCTVEAFAGSSTTTTPAPVVDICDLTEHHCGVRHRRSTNRIVAGQNAGVGAWPWVGGLTLRGDRGVLCGATLIHPEWALTAAHCVEAIKSHGVEADLLLGAHDLLHPQPQLQRRQITNLNSHPLYDSSTLDNDIALVRLASPATMTEYVRLACLSSEWSLRSSAVVTGWGLLEEGGPSAQVLQEAEVGVVEWADCRKVYGSELLASMMCAGGALRDACQGDSGGGLAVQAPSGRWAVAGVVSWGDGCARPGYPGVYANVSNFLPWVRSTTGLAKCQKPEPSASPPPPAGITTTTTSTTTITTTTSSPCRCGRTNKRIVGGQETGVNEYPWHVGVARRGQTHPFCGASVISPRHVLTAAHCTEPITKYRWKVEALVGYHHLASTSSTPAARRLPIGTIHQHSAYNPNTLANDIAIIELSSRLQLEDPRVGPVCLPRPGLLYEGAAAFVTGWGRVSEGGSQPVKLQEVEVPVISNKECEVSYPGAVTSTSLCAGVAEGGMDSCQGDSGGPLVTAGVSGLEQVGVVSWGTGCARPGKPGVYTRVTEYLDWIAAIVGSEDQCT